MYWLAHIFGAPQRVNHAASAVGKLIYSFGGHCSREFLIGSPIDINVFNTDTLEWSKLHYNIENKHEIPCQRFGHTVVVHDNKFYLYGGRDDDSSFRTLHCFNPATNTWNVPKVTGDLPLGLDGHTACVFGDYMYFFGGYEDESETFKETLHRLNFKTFVWEELKIMGQTPEGRDFHTATVIGDRMYIFGGRHYDFGIDSFDGGSYSNWICYFDLTNMFWVWPNVKGTIPIGRRSHSAFAYGKELFILCGYNSNTDEHYDDMFKFNTETNRWSPVYCKGVGPIQRRRQCCVLIDDRAYIFGGTSPSTSDGNRANFACRFDEKIALTNMADLHILDLCPTLYRLCLFHVMSMRLDIDLLPFSIKEEILKMTTTQDTRR